MTGGEHLEILNQGVETWNDWRRENEDVSPNLIVAILKRVNLSGADLRKADLSHAILTEADLTEADLSEANLWGADLGGGNLSGADLRNAYMSRANLNNANLSRANLEDANLSRANLRGANLVEADLCRADLRNAELWDANLRHANLSGANLIMAGLTGVDLSWADLGGANFTVARCDQTTFGDNDLSNVTGLESVRHQGRSEIGIHTLYLSEGKIPEKFLRGCGVPEKLIAFLPSLVEDAIQFYSCFISYSHENEEFAKRLYDRLQGEGIRCWLDEHQLNPGDPLHSTIYEAIRVYDKVLLCCSETALKSWWVEKEFSNAIRKEEDYKDFVLIPLAVDRYLFTRDCMGWVADEIKKRFVADFTNWKEYDAFEKAIKTVIKALRTDRGQLPPPAPKLKPKR